MSFLYLMGCSTTSKIQKSHSQDNILIPDLKLDTVTSSTLDMGKMWTFEDPPLDYFEKRYSFRPDDDWLKDVRMSALKFANWCSASFVSEDGLIMTNHHCVDMIISRIEEEEEDLKKTGFYAEKLEDERKVPNLFVDQLVLIKDVTDDIKTAAEEAQNKQEEDKLIDEKKTEIEKRYSEETGLICKVTELYSGARYSLYGYRRYNDVRAVFITEPTMGLYGGIPDNFSYPRYDMDCAFLRAYNEEGKPVQTDHYFKFSEEGAIKGEPIFVVGNPGSTERLNTLAQLIYMRDHSYRNRSFLLNGLLNVYEEMIKENPEKASEYKDMKFMIGNSAEAIKGQYEGLRDPFLMAKKKDFEEKFKSKVMADPDLKKKYGEVWKGLADLQKEKMKYAGKISAYSVNPRLSAEYFFIAQDMVTLAEQLQMPNDQRQPQYKDENLDSTISIIFPEDFERTYNNKILALQANYMTMNLGKEDELIQKMYGGEDGEEAAEYALSNSSLTSKEDVTELANAGSDAILNSNDPFIYFVLNTREELKELKKKRSEIEKTEKELQTQLGKALYAVYGPSIPPDATFTLRLSDGVMKKYKYNGTEAPVRTTFYGVYDRYYSHGKEEPWKITESWKDPSSEFDLEVPYNFISTNDIIGGNSGSPVINKDKEVVGVAFDGNTESLPGNFIFDPTANRTVSVASEGMIEALADIYSADRLVMELKNGKLPSEFLLKRKLREKETE
jgi:hypothetical protein